MKTVEILLCDDHEIFREGIRTTLKDIDHVNILADAENGAQCLELLKDLVPDVILMDINMPVMDGIKCLQEVKANYPFIKVLALTQFDEKRFVKQMLKFGADGYILKSTSKSEIIKALHTVMNNGIYLSDKAEQKMHNLNTDPNPDPLFPQLTSREREVIKLMCHEMATKQIADKLNLSVHTVESHRTNIFKKIGVNNVAGLVRWAVNNNLD